MYFQSKVLSPGRVLMTEQCFLEAFLWENKRNSSASFITLDVRAAPIDLHRNTRVNSRF